MAEYSFEALSEKGEQVAGVLEAASRREAFREIEARHLAPIRVTEKVPVPVPSRPGKKADANSANTAADHDPTEAGPRLKPARLIFFTSELADLLEAGLPVQQALN